MKTYVIAPDQRTARLYAQAFGMDSDPRRTVLLGSEHALPTVLGVRAGEFYVVNSDNGEINERVVERIRLLELTHPESITVEWIGFGSWPPSGRGEGTAPRPPRSKLARWLRRSTQA